MPSIKKIVSVFFVAVFAGFLTQITFAQTGGLAPLTNTTSTSMFGIATTTSGGMVTATTSNPDTGVVPPVNLDTTPPTHPVPYAPKISASAIYLSWASSTDNVGVIGYVIYRNDAVVGTTQALSFIDSSGLTPGVLYTYHITAYDSASNMSVQNIAVPATIPLSVATVDITPPTISQVRVENVVGTAATLRWYTDDKTNAYLAYGTMPNVYSSSTISNNCNVVTSTTAGGTQTMGTVDNNHCVILYKLLPGATYYYQIRARNTSSLNGISKEYSFVVPPIITSSATTSVGVVIAPSPVVKPIAPVAPPVLLAPPATSVQPTVPPVLVPAKTPPEIKNLLTVQPLPPSSISSKPKINNISPLPLVAPQPFLSTGSTKPIITLKGGTKVVGNTEIYVKFSETVNGVEVRLTRAGITDSLYLGQTQFDSVTGRFVMPWDSTQTPDGAYRLSLLIERADGAIFQGPELSINIENQKNINTNQPVVTTSAGQGTSTAVSLPVSTAPRVVTDIQKVVADIKSEQAKEEIQIKNELASVLSRQVAGGGSPTDLNKLIAEKSKEIKDAGERGDIEKTNEIIASIVTLGGGNASSSDAFAKQVEASVVKLAKVADEQKNGKVDDKNFSVERVKVTETVVKPDGTESAKKIAFRGKALPNSFANLYIFSIPILVTVKTDNDGYWNYTLDKELEDGSHQVYVGITDVKGNIVVKSNPLPFVKTASAVTVEEIPLALEFQDTPSFIGNNYFYGIIVTIVVFIIGVLLLIGIKRSDSSY